MLWMVGYRDRRGQLDFEKKVSCQMDTGATHTADVHLDKGLGPGTVDHIARPQPHEHHEGEEVSVVEVTHTIEHPRWQRDGLGGK